MAWYIVAAASAPGTPPVTPAYWWSTSDGIEYQWTGSAWVATATGGVQDYSHTDHGLSTASASAAPIFTPLAQNTNEAAYAQGAVVVLTASPLLLAGTWPYQMPSRRFGAFVSHDCAPIYQGRDFVKWFYLKNGDGTPFELVDLALCLVRFRGRQDGLTLVEVDSVYGGVTLIRASGAIGIHLPPYLTDSLPLGRGVYGVDLVWMDGSIEYVMSGGFDVLRPVTHD